MNPIFPQRGHSVPATPTAPLAVSTPPTPRTRLNRLAALGPDDKTAALAWLAIHSPAVCDALLTALEEDDDELARQEPEPYCAACGADAGIFLRSGPDWRHFRGTGTPASPIELFDPGHTPTIAWRTPRLTTAR